MIISIVIAITMMVAGTAATLLSTTSALGTRSFTPTAQAVKCDHAYPRYCIPPPPPDLDCKNIPYRNFEVLDPDPHGFDTDGNGMGCETHRTHRHLH